MSKRHPLQATKIFFVYWVCPKIKQFRTAIDDENIPQILDLVIQRPSLIHEPIDFHGNTGLALAIQSGRIKSIKILLRLGSNPNRGNIYNGTHPMVLLVDLSSDNHHPRVPIIAKMLLDAGSNSSHQQKHKAITSQPPNATNRL